MFANTLTGSPSCYVHNTMHNWAVVFNTQLNLHVQCQSLCAEYLKRSLEIIFLHQICTTESSHSCWLEQGKWVQVNSQVNRACSENMGNSLSINAYRVFLYYLIKPDQLWRHPMVSVDLTMAQLPNMEIKTIWSWQQKIYTNIYLNNALHVQYIFF